LLVVVKAIFVIEMRSTRMLKAVKVKILKLNAKGVVLKLILVEAYNLGEYAKVLLQSQRICLVKWLGNLLEIEVV
jgi:hypothetical protein